MQVQQHTCTCCLKGIEDLLINDTNTNYSSFILLMLGYSLRDNVSLLPERADNHKIFFQILNIFLWSLVGKRYVITTQMYELTHTEWVENSTINLNKEKLT